MKEDSKKYKNSIEDISSTETKYEEPTHDWFSEKEIIPEEDNTEESPAEMETNGPETRNGIVINSLFVKIRKGPSAESDVLDIIRKEDRVIILGKENNFYKVCNSNTIGYILSDFIKEE